MTAYELINAFYAFTVKTSPSTSDIATYSVLLMKWNAQKRPEGFNLTLSELKALSGLKDATLRASLKRLESRHMIRTKSTQGVAGLRVWMTCEAEWQYVAKEPRPAKKPSISRTRDGFSEKTETRGRTRKPEETPIAEIVVTRETSRYKGMTFAQIKALKDAEKSET